MESIAKSGHCMTYAHSDWHHDMESLWESFLLEDNQKIPLSKS